MIYPQIALASVERHSVCSGRVSYFERKALLFCVSVTAPSLENSGAMQYMPLRHVCLTRGYMIQRRSTLVVLVSPPSTYGACILFCREKGFSTPLPLSTVKSKFVWYWFFSAVCCRPIWLLLLFFRCTLTFWCGCTYALWCMIFVQLILNVSAGVAK